MRAFRWAVLVMMAVVGCASQHKVEVRPLHAAAGTSAVVSQQLEQGNQLFAQQDWAGAQQVYLATIQADQTLAEAHYNLALTLERLGGKRKPGNTMSPRPTWLPGTR